MRSEGFVGVAKEADGVGGLASGAGEQIRKMGASWN